MSYDNLIKWLGPMSSITNHIKILKICLDWIKFDLWNSSYLRLWFRLNFLFSFRFFRHCFYFMFIFLRNLKICVKIIQKSKENIFWHYCRDRLNCYLENLINGVCVLPHSKTNKHNTHLEQHVVGIFFNLKDLYYSHFIVWGTMSFILILILVLISITQSRHIRSLSHHCILFFALS